VGCVCGCVVVAKGLGSVCVWSQAAADDAESLRWRPAAFYEELGIGLELGVSAVSVDSSARTVALSDGRTVEYDELVCCTSGRARTLRADRHEPFTVEGASLAGIFPLRQVGDAAGVERRLRSKGAEQHVVVVGASFIGMEVASTLASGHLKAGAIKSVTVVALEKEPLERVIGAECGRALRGFAEAAGVAFRLESTVDRFQPAPDAPTEVGSVLLKSGEVLPADTVVLGTGILPSYAYLESTAGVTCLPRGGGVTVDARLRAADHIYVAGDIAHFPYKFAAADAHNSAVRIEHWDVAVEHGRVVARNILGGEVAYDRVPFFWSNQFGKGLRYAGNTLRWDRQIIHGVTEGPGAKFTAYFVVGPSVAAVATLNDDPNAVAARELIRLGKLPSVADLDAATGRVDLQELLTRVTTTVSGPAKI
jgi:NADPH-dependent 2,4-dienoyl-CoA reductase/sulfur reductase-like enzyme